MSVAHSDIGFADTFIQNVNDSTSISANKIDETNDLRKLYKEGKEYTYLLTVAGKSNNVAVNITPGFKNVTSVEVVQARIPFTEYTIESDRNTISGTITTSTLTDVAWSITLATRDYTNDDLIEEFNAKAKLLTTAQGAGATLRMDELEGTGKFFFYTLDWTATGVGTLTHGGTEHPTFTISATTTAFYPLGLATQLGGATSDLKSSDYSSVASPYTPRKVLNSTDQSSTYKFTAAIESPYRYDLVVSDLISLRCEELDGLLNRGHESANIMPLGEFFLASPGMNESTFQKAIPDRPIAPPIELNTMSFRFTRENTGNNVGEIMEYNFRGVKWFLKIAIKTLEISSQTAIDGSLQNNGPLLDPSYDMTQLTEGFKNSSVGPRRTIQTIPQPGVSSMMSRHDGRTSGESQAFTYIPSASNSGTYGDI